MGAPKPDRGPGRPIDYFRAKVGDDGSHAAAAKKFHSVYGDKPRAIDILLPPEITTALHVEHIAWGSGGMKARGHTNFASVGTLGGPDTLTVWNEDGTVDEIEIEDVDDPAAKTLEVSLYTTFQFYIPDVLGAASLCAITSKGQKTTDNLFAKLVELYGYFGSRVTFIVKPKLVLRPATGRPTVIDKETKKPKRIKSSFYALDLYVPESFDEMFERLAQRQELLGGRGGPISQLYGPQASQPRPEIERATVADRDADDEYETVEGEIVDGEDSQKGAADAGPEASGDPAGGSGGNSTGDELVTDGTPAAAPGAEPPAPPSGFQIPDSVLDAAAAHVVVHTDPKSGWNGRTLASISADQEYGAKWLAWAAGPDGDLFLDEATVAAVRLLVEHRHPAIWAEVTR